MTFSQLKTTSTYETLYTTYGPTMISNHVAEVLHCHPSHVRALCQRGELPAVRIGDRWHIVTAKFADLLDGDSYEG